MKGIKTMSIKTTQRELKEYAKQANIIDIPHYKFEQIKAIREKEKYFEEIAYSTGTYGLTGLLLQGFTTKQKYIITSRTSALYAI